MTILLKSTITCLREYVTLKGIRGWYGSRARYILKAKRRERSQRYKAGVSPLRERFRHLEATENLFLGRQTSQSGYLVENPNRLRGLAYRLTEDSTWGLENRPKPYFKYKESGRCNQKQLQVQRFRINDQT